MQMSAQSDYGVFQVLRRWNSFTPRLPVSESSLGGGYLLEWNGKHIAIDPGFDFIRNHYQARRGWSRRIDAIILTHDHIDHTDSFPSLLTMKYERIDRFGKSGERAIDLLLSFDSYERFAGLISRQNKPIVDRDSIHILYPGAKIDLRLNRENPYDIVIEVLNSNHTPYSVGLIFNLYETNSTEPILRIGLTSDTSSAVQMEDSLLKCDIVVAHLGSISLRQMVGLSRLSPPSVGTKQLLRLLEDAAPSGLKLWESRLLFKEILGAHEREMPLPDTDHVTLVKELVSELRNLFNDGEVISQICDEKRSHLELPGILDLVSKLITAKNGPRLIILSEFGEELGSFRHELARVFCRQFEQNMAGGRRVLTGDVNLAVYLKKQQVCNRKFESEKCTVGSGCPDSAEGQRILIQCTKCLRFVPLECIDEICIRNRAMSMFYNCPYCWKEERSPKAPFFIF